MHQITSQTLPIPLHRSDDKRGWATKASFLPASQDVKGLTSSPFLSYGITSSNDVRLRRGSIAELRRQQVSRGSDGLSRRHSLSEQSSLHVDSYTGVFSEVNWQDEVTECKPSQQGII